MTAKKTAAEKKRKKPKPPAPDSFDALEKAFWKNVRKAKTCWFWQGRTVHGWPRFDMGEQSYSARRAAYEISSGVSLDEKLRVVTTCRRKRCVNPEHLKTEPRSKKDAGEMERVAQEAKKTIMENNRSATNVVVAHERRMLGDATQKSWDVCQEPQRMLGAVTGQPGFGALPGPQRWSTELMHLLSLKLKSGTQVDRLALQNALLITGRLLRDGDTGQPATLLQPILRRMGIVAANDVVKILADLIRSFYPSAPEGWV
jgi:hypothetical protein